MSTTTFNFTANATLSKSGTEQINNLTQHRFTGMGSYGIGFTSIVSTGGPSASWSGSGSLSVSGGSASYTRSVSITGGSTEGTVKIRVQFTRPAFYEIWVRETYDYWTYNWTHPTNPRMTITPIGYIPTLPPDIGLNYPNIYHGPSVVSPCAVVLDGNNSSYNQGATHSFSIDSPTATPTNCLPSGEITLYWKSGDLRDLTDYFLSNYEHSIKINVGNRPIRFLIGIVYLEEA